MLIILENSYFDIINTMVPTEMAIDAGTVILGMILDTLTGRSSLYMMEEEKDR